MTDRAPADALVLARRALSRAPAGFLTDLDGTIAPIVADPAAARLADRGAATLRALAARLAVAGIVTGRAGRDARRIAGVDELLVVGNHGLEWLEPGASEPVPAPGLGWMSDELDRVMGAARAALGDPGITLDHKGLSGTIHYRRSADPAGARRRLLATLDVLPHRGIEVREGRMSVELRPTGVGDKGTAVRQIVERHGLRGLVVMGDDVTDLDMFRAAAELRAAGTIEAAILAVGSDAEVPAAVIAAADATVAGPAAVVALLEALVSS